MNDKYDFLKEQVKKQKPYMKWLHRAGAAAFSGVIIGVVVLLIMVFIYPRLDRAVNPKPAAQVDLGKNADREAQDTQDAVSTVSDVKVSDQEVSVVSSAVESDNVLEQPSEEEKEPTVAVQPQEKTTAESLTKVSEDIMALSSSLSRSMVTVIGVTEDKDWFNETYENQGQLSGLIVANEDKAYYILTEYRVVKDVNRIMVTFADGQTADARFVKCDDATSLAIIRVNMDDVPRSTRDVIEPVELKRYTSVRQGEAVVALGSPMGYSDAVTTGLVTSTTNILSITDNAYHIVCTDIPVSEDGSGILVDMDGNVVGIMAQQLLDTKELGLMTCLPLSEILETIETLCNNKQLAYVGITGQEVSSAISERTGIPKGIWIDSVDTDSPAMETGIQPGDVIYQLDDTEIGSLKTFHVLINQKKIGDVVDIHVMRRSVEGYVDVSFKVEIKGR